MRRRDLIALFGGASVVCLAVGVRAQPAKTFRLGILVNTRNASVDELLKGLRDHGYVEGQNLVVELRFSEGAGERWPQLAKELAALKVDAIVVQTTPAAEAGDEHNPDRHNYRDRPGWSGSGGQPRPAWRQCYRGGVATT